MGADHLHPRQKSLPPAIGTHIPIANSILGPQFQLSIVNSQFPIGYMGPYAAGS